MERLSPWPPLLALDGLEAGGRADAAAAVAKSPQRVKGAALLLTGGGSNSSARGFHQRARRLWQLLQALPLLLLSSSCALAFPCQSGALEKPARRGWAGRRGGNPAEGNRRFRQRNTNPSRQGKAEPRKATSRTSLPL